jgi:hypothetical protein
MGLKELSESMNKKPELYRHPSSQWFHTKFPVIKEKVNGLDNDKLISLIRSQGDKQRRRTNVKANMTNWFMHREHETFMAVARSALGIAKENSPHVVQMNVPECWGAIYKKGDWTKTHDHWPYIWSFTYYVQCKHGDAPLVFPDAELSIYPEAGDMIVFPSWVRHSVPEQTSDSERIVVAGNIKH